MATELLYATAHIAGDFLNPANANDDTPTTWAGNTNANELYTSRWAIGDPVDPLTAAATQTVRVIARKGTNSGNPTIALNLYENGALVQEILGTTSIISTTGETLTGTFSSSVVTNPADVEIEVVQTGAGGSPAVRNCAQISRIEWTADTTAAVTTTVTLGGTLPALDGSLDVDALADMAFAGVLPALTGSFDATATADIDMAGTLPPVAGDFTVDEGGGIFAASNVRAFTTADILDTATGALATSAFGTLAIIVKRAATGAWHTFLAMHNSGGDAVNQLAYNDSNLAVWWIDGTTVTGPAAIGTSDWGLIVARKATGTATPRFSLYNFTTDTWSHANASGTRPNWSAPGASGTVRFRWQTVDQLAGRVAVRAAWNSLPWSADTSGDAAIETAGLEVSAANWLDVGPDAMWLFNQDAVTTAVEDVTGGGADQTAITGTTVVTDDAPPGFSFDLEPGGATDVTLVGTLPALTGSFDVATSADVGLSAILPALDGSLTVDATADVELAGQLPALAGSFQIVETDLNTVTLDGVLPALTGSFDIDATAQAVLAGTLPALDGSFEIDAGGEPVPPSYISVTVGPLRDPLQVDQMREPLQVGTASGELVTVGALSDTAPTIGELRDEQSPTIGELRDPLAVDEMRDPLTVDELKE